MRTGRRLLRRAVLPPMESRQVIANVVAPSIELTYTGSDDSSIVRGYEFRLEGAAAGLYRVVEVVDGKIRAEKIDA